MERGAASKRRACIHLRRVAASGGRVAVLRADDGPATPERRRVPFDFEPFGRLRSALGMRRARPARPNCARRRRVNGPTYGRAGRRSGRWTYNDVRRDGREGIDVIASGEFYMDGRGGERRSTQQQQQHVPAEVGACPLDRAARAPLRWHTRQPEGALWPLALAYLIGRCVFSRRKGL